MSTLKELAKDAKKVGLDMKVDRGYAYNDANGVLRTSEDKLLWKRANGHISKLNASEASYVIEVAQTMSDAKW